MGTGSTLRPLLLGVLVLCRSAMLFAEWETPNDPAYRRYPADPHQESLFLLRMEEAWKIEKVRAYIISLSGKHFDPKAVDLFLRMIGERRRKASRAKSEKHAV